MPGEPSSVASTGCTLARSSAAWASRKHLTALPDKKPEPEVSVGVARWGAQ